MIKKQKVILTRGLIASGKSTWATSFVKNDQTYKRVNRDSFRHMLSSYTFNKDNEKLVEKVQREVIKTILEESYNLIIDETNLNPRTLENNIKTVQEIIPGIEIEVKNFYVSLEEAIIRDAKRDFPIGEKIIRRMWKDYIYKEHQENLIEYNYDLPDCIIVDIDGTLALKGDRNPFDYSKVKEDKPNEPILELLEILQSHDVFTTVIFSGREAVDGCIKDTYNWLEGNEIYFDKLVMRKQGDMRKDSIVKKEMYEEHIKGKYNVLYVIDDRKQVVEMWRELGLTVLDVGGHEF